LKKKKEAFGGPGGRGRHSWERPFVPRMGGAGKRKAGHIQQRREKRKGPLCQGPRENSKPAKKSGPGGESAGRKGQMIYTK